MKHVLALFMLAATVSPASSQQTDATIQALLSEVRQLRMALERSAVVAPKIQVTLQRIQLQQDFVTRLSRQVDEARELAARPAREQMDMSNHLKATEALLSQESDPARRKVMEEDIRRLKTHMEQFSEQQKLRDAQQQARETELAGRLQAEQAKLDELNDRLNTLERQLEPPQKP